jgi:hypothetical protein
MRAQPGAFFASILFSVFVAASVSAGEGLGHCGHNGVGVGHDHHDDDCDDSTPTPTATSTPTPTPIPNPTPSPTATPPGSSGLVWRDATGAIVPGVHVLHVENSFNLLGLAYRDQRGFVWHIDPWTLALSPIPNGSTPAVFRFYTTSNCSGEGYFAVIESVYPRIVFRVDGDPAYRSFPDNPTQMTLALHSVDGGVGTACSPYAYTLTVVPSSETLPTPAITVPVVPFVGPIHPDE